MLKRMASVIRKTTPENRQPARERAGLDEWGYPSGMVWCPMKMSGMALMKCAEMQKKFGCGSVRQLKILTMTKPGSVPFHWPWLRRSRECTERAREDQVRELRVALSPLKLVKKSRNDSREDRCPQCSGRKVIGARQCRRCWRCGVEK